MLALSDHAFDEGELSEADEVIQPSSLRDYTWPKEDPSLFPQPVRQADDDDLTLILEAATAATLDADSLTKSTRDLDIARKVHFVLTHRKFQINPVSELRSEELWVTRIREFVDRGEPIRIVYPLMCKIGSWAKQMTNVGPTAGELATILFFRHLNRVVQDIYEPGLRIAVVSDAMLYNSAFSNPQVEVATYMSLVRSQIATYASDFIDFYDYVDLLTECSDEYTALHHKYQRLMCESPGSVLSDVRRKTLFESVKASINVRKFGMSYADMRDLFSADINRSNRHWDIIDTMTRLAMEELVAIRKACMDLNYFERRWPGHVRVSCHKDRKGGRWVIGLRPYPEYYGSSKLLPYHGVPLVHRDSKDRIKMDVVPEVMLRGRTSLTRVESHDGEVYFYDGSDRYDPTLLSHDYEQSA
ncbi:MAG TPA: L-tyrosine/L-tryptophan isonitrile synthase family protein [Frankiaceae bacterium]|nr:L-tyrosine/L-tryptophan isonitrile synthase family protein [Frankiaceae bacterium]